MLRTMESMSAQDDSHGASELPRDPFAWRSARTFEAGGALNPTRAAEARAALERFGAVHVRETGIDGIDDALHAMEALGFGEGHRFVLGGRTSDAWQRKWVAPGLRRMDYYPPDRDLLPNNEVQYQRRSPRWVLLYCHALADRGGRIFVHSARSVEEALRRGGSAGRGLLARYEAGGLEIETGFLDRRHPAKAENYFASWQERFETDDPDEALATASERRDEYDACWWRDEGLRGADGARIRTLMTRIRRDAYGVDPRDGARYLRFPRLAADAPSARNGWRRFPIGGRDPSDEERRALLQAFLETREGAPAARGDVILFDNLRFGHSREPFEGPREVFVAMAGEQQDTPSRDEVKPAPTPRTAARRYARAIESTGVRYAIEDGALSYDMRFSARTLDVGGALDADRFAAIREAFARHGAVHVQRTGLRCADGGALPDEVLEALGFGADETFAWGGMSSGRTRRKALSRTLRATDEYPAHLWLLPHNEVLYQRELPAALLLFSAEACDRNLGGRTWVHSAHQFESHLRGHGPAGLALLEALRAHGTLIEMGFVDEGHPEKRHNYFRSWQDRFDTEDPALAEARCRAATEQFDACWWREEPDAPDRPTLMTRVRVPGAHRDPSTGEERLFFPRIALDAPSVRNGHRRYPLGDGRALTDEEIDLLLEAFLATREGVHYRAGDLLLVDNRRYGHSREPFEGPRAIAVALGGRFATHTPQGAPR
jgi:alpha-ketoglutarate-dependent taurine dioxygenase